MARAFACMLLFIASAATAANEVDALLEDLAGSGTKARVRARQLLPREGVAAAPGCIALLNHDSAAVWWAAKRVLEDVIHGAAHDTPARERLSRQLMALLAPETSNHLKEQALGLLPRVVPPGFDVAPMAALLKHPELHEKARRALVETGTPEALQALLDALPPADPPFKAALLHGAAKFKSGEAADSALELAGHESAAVRAAAARVLAATGGPTHLDTLQEIRNAAGEDTRFAATDALLQCADFMVARGIARPRGLDVYRHVLNTAANPVLQSAALVSLGRYGDETVIPEIAAALEAHGPDELAPAAAAAMEYQNGRAAVAVLRETYPAFSPAFQPLLLGVLGRKQQPELVPVLAQALEHDNPAHREAAVAALADTELPEALAPLRDFAQNVGEAERDAASAALHRLARAFRDAGRADAAGQAYLALYHAADSDDGKQAALAGIEQFPVPDAAPVILEAMDTEAMTEFPVATLAALHLGLREAGRAEKTETIHQAILERMNDTAAVQALMDHANKTKTQDAWRGRFGVIRQWRFLGPIPGFSRDAGFQSPPIDVADPGFNKTYTFDGQPRTWQPYVAQGLNGMMNLMGVVAHREHCSAYAVARVTVPEATEAVVRIGSDDGVRLWVNGEHKHQNNADRGAALDQDLVPVQLNAGENTLVFQITQIAGGWTFTARLTTPEGMPLEFEQ